MTTPILWTVLTACSGSEEKSLVDDVYQAHIAGEDFLGTEEIRQLTEKPSYQSQDQFKQIHAFAKHLFDDDLSEAEFQELIKLGVREEDLEKYNWHHAWTRSALARWDGFDVPFDGKSEPDDEEGVRIFKRLQTRVDLSSLNKDEEKSWEKKLAFSEKIEREVISQHQEKPGTAAEAIRLYAQIEPDLKPIPRSFIEILRTERTEKSLNGKEEMVSAIEYWATQTKNTIVVEELLNTVFEMKMEGVEAGSYKNILRVLALAAKAEDVSEILTELDPEFYPVMAEVFAEKENAKDFAKAWSEVKNPEVMPDKLKAIYDTDVYNEKVEAKKELLLEDKTKLESLIFQGSDSEFVLYLAAINLILKDDQNAFGTEELSFLKDKILNSNSSNVISEVKVLLSLKPDLIDEKDYFLLAVALSTEDIASHEFKDEIIQSVRSNSSQKAFDLLVSWAMAAQFEVSWDEVYEKAVQTGKHTNETLLTDLISEKQLSKPYWQKLIDEDVRASIRILQASKNESEQKALVQIMLGSENSESYRILAPKLALSKEIKDLFLDPLAELRGKIPEAILETLVPIKAGKFMMGSPDGVGESAEHPRHEVEITKDFYAGKYEVTNAMWKVVAGTNPSKIYGSEFTGDNQPVVGVSAIDIEKLFMDKLNKMLPRNSRWEFRLPTEAEWEYMARAGNPEKFPWGSDASQACGYANIADQTAKENEHVWETFPCDDGYYKTAPVNDSRFQSNEFGLYHMIGNVHEWTADGYDKDYYANSPSQDPYNQPTEGQSRVLRGGSWFNDDSYARSANRDRESPGYASGNVGFRLVVAPKS